MLPERHVWIFSASGAPFPGGAFSTLERAEAWIAAHRLTGTLTAYPLDEGAFHWAHRLDLVTGRARDRGDDAAFVGGFSSAAQEHYHYAHGQRDGDPDELDARQAAG